MYRGGDSVFRLSLIGLAFIFICFLLIVFSRLYADADVARTEALSRLDRFQQEGALPLTQQVFESTQKELQTQLSELGVNPEKVIHDLLDKSKAEAELATERKRVQEFSVQLAGLTETRKILTQASRNPVLDGKSVETLASALDLRTRLEQELLLTPHDPNATGLSDGEIASRALAAINFKRNIETLVERELGLPFVPGQEPAWEQWLLSDSTLFRSTLTGLAASTAGNAPRGAGSEDSNALHGQINFLRARLETHNDKTTPPCWFDNAGRVQFLFTIELLPRASNHVTVKSAWPPARETTARTIPGVDQILTLRNQTYESFRDRARKVARHSGPQCRYSVQVIDRLNHGMRSERIHKELETLFHLVNLPH
jgi:hypothetical protein